MKRLLSILLSFSLVSMSSFASPQRAEGLKDAIREFRYAVEVEWDQRDQEFYKQQVSKFKSRLQELDLEGASKKEVLAEALDGLPESSAKKSVETMLTVIDPDQMSAQELQNHLMRIANEIKPTGAQWIDNVFEDHIIEFFVLFSVLIFVVPLLITKGDNPEPNRTGGTGGGTGGGTVDPTPTPDSSSDQAPNPTYQCGYEHICWTITTNLYDGWTGMPLIGYQDYCGMKYVCSFR